MFLNGIFWQKIYISTEDLTISDNASIALERPLLVKGETKLIKMKF